MNAKTKVMIRPMLFILGFAYLLCPPNSLAAKAVRPSPTVDLVFVGDILLGRRPGKFIAQGQDPFAGFASVLAAADIRVGNLECVAADSGLRAEKHYTFRADPAVLSYVAKHFDAVSLANNHTVDFGPEALTEMFGNLKSAKVNYFGAGENKKRAHAPWIVEKKGLRIAILGYNEFRPRSFEATETKAGVAWSEDAEVIEDIRAVRSQVDLVLTFMHWGEEYLTHPNARQKNLARKMIDAGADVVIGGHPHVTEGSETYKGKLIVYSLGNFVFDDFADMHRESRWELEELSRTSWVLRLTMDKTGVKKWDTLVARTDDRGFPNPVPGAKGPSSLSPFSAELLEPLAATKPLPQGIDQSAAIKQSLNIRIDEDEIAAYTLDKKFLEASVSFRSPQVVSDEVFGECRLRQFDFNARVDYPDPDGFDFGLKELSFKKEGEAALSFLPSNYFRDMTGPGFAHAQLAKWLSLTEKFTLVGATERKERSFKFKTSGVAPYKVKADGVFMPGKDFHLKVTSFTGGESLRIDISGYNTNRNRGYHLGCLPKRSAPSAAKWELTIPAAATKLFPIIHVPQKELNIGIEMFNTAAIANAHDDVSVKAVTHRRTSLKVKLSSR